MSIVGSVIYLTSSHHCYYCYYCCISSLLIGYVCFVSLISIVTISDGLVSIATILYISCMHQQLKLYQIIFHAYRMRMNWRNSIDADGLIQMSKTDLEMGRTCLMKLHSKVCSPMLSKDLCHIFIYLKGLLATKFTLQLFGIKRFTMSYSAVL